MVERKKNRRSNMKTSPRQKINVFFRTAMDFKKTKKFRTIEKLYPMKINRSYGRYATFILRTYTIILHTRYTSVSVKCY